MEQVFPAGLAPRTCPAGAERWAALARQPLYPVPPPTGVPRVDIGELFFERGLVTREQLDVAQKQAAGRRIDSLLVETGLVNEEDALKALADALGLKFADLQNVEVDRSLLAKFPTSAIFRHAVLPLARDNGKGRVAISDPFNLEALNELSALSRVRPDPVLARRDDVLQRIKEHLGVGGATINELVSRNIEEGV